MRRHARALQERGARGALAASGHVLVLGSGATARSAVAALAGLGAARVTFAVRARGTAETVAQARARGMDVAGVRAGCRARAGAGRVVGGVHAAGGAAPAGILGDGADLSGRVLLDVVYAGWPTPLARSFEERGDGSCRGSRCCCTRRRDRCELMTGLAAPVAAMRAAGLAAMGDR